MEQMKTQYGLQMYSLRDITKDSMRLALEKVAEMGYKYVEFAGFFDYTAEQIKIWLDEFGLVASGTHTGLKALTPETIDATVAYHKAIGCDNIIVPGATWKTPEDFDNNISALLRARERLAKDGITLGYHNHSAEFFKTDFGRCVETELIENTDLELEIDTFWSFNAGMDNQALLESLKNRIRVIHIKDGIPTAPENRNVADWHKDVKGLSLGLGKAPVREVVEWAKKNGVRMVVESEGLEPTGLEEVGRCIEFLKTLE